MTPGAKFILNSLTQAFLPPIAFYGLVWIIQPPLLSTISSYQIAALILLFPIAAEITRLCIIRLWQRWRAYRLGAELPPEVNGRWPGNIDRLLHMLKVWRNGYPGDGPLELIGELGVTYNVRLFWENTIFTADPDHVKRILSTDFANYVKGSKFMAAMNSVLGSGVFNSNGDLWHFHRSMSRPFFNQERIADLENFTRHVDRTLRKLRGKLGLGFAVDMQDLTARFTLDSATEFLFGESVHSLGAPLPDAWNQKQTNLTIDPTSPQKDCSIDDSDLYLPSPSPCVSAFSPTQTKFSSQSDDFSNAFTRALHSVTTRLRTGKFWQLLEVKKDRTADDVAIIKSFVRPILDNALRRKHDKKFEAEKSGRINDIVEEGMDESRTLLDHLVELSDDVSLIEDELINFLIAGRDTTASTITMAIYLLSQHPEVLSRLREDIFGALGSGSASKIPSVEDIRSMKYLRAVINETLRLFPPVPFNVRDSVNESVWDCQDGRRLYIPAGTSITYSLLHMHRSTEHWGPTASQFDPNRFLDPSNNPAVTHPFIFLPFNAGPRICLGQQLAYRKISLFLIRLVQNFKHWELDESAIPPEARIPEEWRLQGCSGDARKPVEKVWPRSHLTMYIQGGLWMRFRQ